MGLWGGDTKEGPPAPESVKLTAGQTSHVSHLLCALPLTCSLHLILLLSDLATGTPSFSLALSFPSSL